MKDMNSAGQNTARLIQGFVALCFGSTDRLVWMDQPDAAAYADESHVYLPTPSGVPGEQELLLSIAMREVARLAHTDAESFVSAKTEFAGFAASIEDARIKQAIAEDYKGASSIFEAATNVIHKVAVQALTQPDTSDEQLKQFTIWFAANDALLGTTATRTALTDLTGRAGQRIDGAMLQQAVGLAQASPYLGSTKAAVACGSRIYEILKEVEDSPPPEQRAEQSDDTQAQEDSKSDSSAGAESEGEADDSAETSQGQSNQQDVDNQSDGNDPAQGSSPTQGVKPQSEDGSSHSEQASPGSGPPSRDPMSNALAMLKGYSGARAVQAQKAEGPQQCEPGDPELMRDLAHAMAQPDAMQRIAQMVEDQSTQDEANAGDPGSQGDGDEVDDSDPMDALGASSELATVTYLPGANTLDAIPGRLVNVLLRVLHDKRPTKMLRRESGSEIDVPNVWQLKHLGETRVFRKKTPTSGIDAAVHILLDRSASMKNSIREAANSTNAFAMALQRISGVRTAIDLFPSGSGPTQSILAFRQNPTKAKARLRSVQAGGGTPTHWAIHAILPSLLDTPVQKRVIVLITDGDPDDEIATRAAIAKAKVAGVDVIGIGIGTRVKIERILPNRSVKIDSVIELPQALDELFRSKLSTSLLAA